MGIPTSPDTELYTVGKGVLSIAQWSGGAPGTYTDVGNCSAIEVEVTEEKLDHFSSRSGIRLKDKQITLEIGYTVNFTLDEVSVNNLRLFIKGTLSNNKLYANQNMNAEFALRFVSANPAGPDETWNFWRATLSPNGAFSLISDEWATLAFTAEGLADTTNHSDSPYFDVYYVTTTSTTSSSSTTTS